MSLRRSKRRATASASAAPPTSKNDVDEGDGADVKPCVKDDGAEAEKDRGGDRDDGADINPGRDGAAGGIVLPNDSATVPSPGAADVAEALMGHLRSELTDVVSVVQAEATAEVHLLVTQGVQDHIDHAVPPVVRDAVKKEFEELRETIPSAAKVEELVNVWMTETMAPFFRRLFVEHAGGPAAPHQVVAALTRALHLPTLRIAHGSALNHVISEMLIDDLNMLDAITLTCPEPGAIFTLWAGERYKLVIDIVFCDWLVRNGRLPLVSQVAVLCGRSPAVCLNLNDEVYQAAGWVIHRAFETDRMLMQDMFYEMIAHPLMTQGADITLLSPNAEEPDTDHSRGSSYFAFARTFWGSVSGDVPASVLSGSAEVHVPPEPELNDGAGVFGYGSGAMGGEVGQRGAPVAVQGAGAGRGGSAGHGGTAGADAAYIICRRSCLYRVAKRLLRMYINSSYAFDTEVVAGVARSLRTIIVDGRRSWVRMSRYDALRFPGPCCWAKLLPSVSARKGLDKQLQKLTAAERQAIGV